MVRRIELVLFTVNRKSAVTYAASTMNASERCQKEGSCDNDCERM